MRPSERVLFGVAAAISIVLRALAFARYRVDSDEPQHLHVTWGWTAGLLQYRDVFDNHPPLFHIATAPLLAALGERPDIILWMRAAMLPLFATVIVCTFLIGRQIYSARVGAWAALLLSLFPPFFLKSLEFRTDNLWNALWMIVLTLAVSGTLTTPRAFLIGLLLGTALAVSLKTVLLVLSVVAAALVVRHVSADRKALIRYAAAGTAGFVLVPLAVLGWFMSRNALPDLIYGVATFNSRLAETRLLVWTGRISYPFAVAGLVMAARRRGSGNPQRLFVAFAAAMYVITLVSLWPLIGPRDLLPVMPVAAIFFTGTIDRLRHRPAIFATVVVTFVLALFYYADRFENRMDEHVTMMVQALRLSHPGEAVMDHKGETIYRHRPFRYPFEIIAREQLRRGMIADTIPEDVIAARAYVAQADGDPWPPRGRKFLLENFLDMGRLRAAGQWIGNEGRFTIAIPGPYAIVDENGHVRGTLDGQAWSGSGQLGAGPHLFVPAAPGQRLAVLWAPAFERGHSPFHLRDREF